ncbi:ribonuclease P protein component [Buchnera aphidicola]|uniref:ribonuclease P protein component n=1 Tax=Buchnera aphidicola TaxID=9 RepID=UPI0031B7EF2D
MNRFFLKKNMRIAKFSFDNSYIKKFHQFNDKFIKIFSILNEFFYPRIGIIISKTVSKYSYKRNFLRRIIKESFRIKQYILFKMDFIIIVKSNFVKMRRNIIYNYLNKIWLRYSK